MCFKKEELPTLSVGENLPSPCRCDGPCCMLGASPALTGNVSTLLHLHESCANSYPGNCRGVFVCVPTLPLFAVCKPKRVLKGLRLTHSPAQMPPLGPCKSQSQQVRIRHLKSATQPT